MTHGTDQAASLEDADPSAADCSDPADARCAVARCADVVCGKWTMLLVRDLAAGPRSFSELEASLKGISPRTLCDRLKLLATEGLLTRTRIKGLPPRTIYELTMHGMELVPLVEAMRRVGESMLVRTPDPAAAEAITAEASCCDDA